MSTVEYNFEITGAPVSKRVIPAKPCVSAKSSNLTRSTDPAGSSNSVGPSNPVRVADSAGSRQAKKLHRIHEVRQQQGASLRSVARKLDMPIQDVRGQEEPSSDLRISDLLQWQEILEVPLADLLVDTQGPLSESVSKRASMLRVMKTSKAILESTKNKSVRRLANMLVEQLVQMMPELADVSAWHTVGQRRTQEEVGRIVERSIPDSFFNEGSH